MKKLLSLAALGVVATAALAYPGAFKALFSSNYLPHRYCYLIQPGLVWTNVSTDALIAISYAVIFGCLIWIASRLRAVAPFRAYLWIFISFGLFIAACGATHAMEVVTVWWPVYPLSAAVKVLCAAASVPTAILFARATPRLERAIAQFVNMLSTTEQERDLALIALTLAEKIAEQRSQAAADIAAAHAQLETVMDSTSDAILQVSHEWIVLYGNRKAIENFTTFQSGAPFWECFPAIISTVAEKKLRISMVERRETECEIYYPPNKTWVCVHAFPTASGISIFYRDMTVERELQTQLTLEQELREKRIEALSHMAGGLAHEISNPLAIIHAMASDLLSVAAGANPIPTSTIRAACDKIVRTSDRAIRILRGLRGFAREGGNDPMELAPIGEIIEQSIEMQQDRFERHNVGLTVSVAADIPPIFCRETQIGQVITNLLNNAFDAIVQANSPDRWIELSAERAGENVCIDVTDSGPGVDAKHRSHLMEPFFTTKELGLGMGVGLSLSRSIAQDHGGTLTLRDGTDHTSFRLVLPIGKKIDDPRIGAIATGAAE